MTTNFFQIRQSVFETNSSSSHSMTMKKGDLVDQPFTKEELRDGVVKIYVQEYGWEQYRYYNPKNKLSYLLTQITSGDLPDGDSHQITSSLIETNERFAMLSQIVKEYCGCELLVQPGSGYVDHESVGNGCHLFRDIEELKLFIFSKDSYIETGNDNSPMNWIIDTDRGQEKYYADKIGNTGDDFVGIKLHSVIGQPTVFATSAGGLIDNDENPELFSEIVSNGVITSSEWVCFDSYSLSGRNEDARSKTVSWLTRSKNNPFKFSENFVSRIEIKIVNFHEEVDNNISFVINVPSALSKKINELDPKGHRTFMLDMHKNNITRYKQYLDTNPDNSYYKEKLKASEKIIASLTFDRANKAKEVVKSSTTDDSKVDSKVIKFRKKAKSLKVGL